MPSYLEDNVLEKLCKILIQFSVSLITNGNYETMYEDRLHTFLHITSMYEILFIRKVSKRTMIGQNFEVIADKFDGERMCT